MRSPLIFFDADRRSYRILAEHYRRTLSGAVSAPEYRSLPTTRAERGVATRLARGRVALQCTIGPIFAPLPGAINIAIPLHEWSRYPQAWVERLEGFDAVWAPTGFVRRVLGRSGLEAPLSLVPPALDHEHIPAKSSWTARSPFRFLSCGEAHFRKGFHLLVAAFLEAFPREGEATLTIRTSPECQWTAPRSDVVFDTRALSRVRQLSAYSDYDAYVTASLGEGLGLPVAEAVLAGLPVVANLWGGHADLLAEGSCFRIPHKVVPQPFASQPSYYAPAQKCALSSVDDLVGALTKAVGATMSARARMAGEARSHLLRRFGCEAAAASARRALVAVRGSAVE